MTPLPRAGRAPSGRAVSAERFHEFCVAVVARLPFGFNSVVAPTFLGFALINGFTFGVDLLLLSVVHAGLGLALPIAVTVAYACAFTLSYYLNRTMNFHSHAPVGPQFTVYVVVVVVNYLAFILGVSSALPRSVWTSGWRESWQAAVKRFHVQRHALGRLPPLTHSYSKAKH